MKKLAQSFLIFFISYLSLGTGTGYAQSDSKQSTSELLWTMAEIEFLKSFSIQQLPLLEPDLSNRYSTNLNAAKMGHQIFFDARFSSNGQVSCATCHDPQQQFTDPQALSKGVGTTARHSMSIIGSAYSPWFFWDGRKDSQWSQALGPLESPVEHGGTRTLYARLIDIHYRSQYETIFGVLPDLSDSSRFPKIASPVHDGLPQKLWKSMESEDKKTVNRVFANIGKAIAAYERLLIPGSSRFDQFVDKLVQNEKRAADSLLSQEEQKGLKIFIGKGNCAQCHNGPLFTNNSFHNIGIPVSVPTSLDLGRIEGAKNVVEDEFNCFSEFSDAKDNDCLELKFIKTEGRELIGAFRTASLRNVAGTPPYMHAGQFTTLREVLLHYNEAKSPVYPSLVHSNSPISDIVPLGLSGAELQLLEAFLHTLESPISINTKWLTGPIH